MKPTRTRRPAAPGFVPSPGYISPVKTHVGGGLHVNVSTTTGILGTAPRAQSRNTGATYLRRTS